MKAQAIVFRSANQPKIEEIDIPAIMPDEVRIRTLYSGVSIGTESSIFSGIRTHNGTFPLVGGYMITGIVEESGAAVTDFSPGDKVVSGGGRLEGEINSVFGGHMSHVVIPASRVSFLPDDVDEKEAALFVLPKVGLEAVSMAEITEKDRVLIFGQGMIGQFFGQFARNRGARIVTVEPDKKRASLSRQYVTATVLDPMNDDIEKRVEELTSGQGPTVVVEATGSKEVIHQATAALRPDGRFVFLSWHPGEIALEYSHFHANRARILFPMGGGDRETTRAVLDSLAAGTIHLEDNLTDVVNLENACDGYRRIIAGDRSIIGMVIDWR